MKKILQTLTCGRTRLIATFAAVLCCAIISTVFTACKNDEQDSVSNFAAYDVVTINSSGNSLIICENMQEALRTGMPLDNKVCNKRDDAKAIRICDEVYKKSYATAHFKIILRVTPFGNGLDNKATDLKTYEF